MKSIPTARMHHGGTYRLNVTDSPEFQEETLKRIAQNDYGSMDPQPSTSKLLLVFIYPNK
jgi:hypothetical protein